MNQNADNDCSCNNYFSLFANTGIANISAGSSDLTGLSGTVQVLLANGSANGTIIKSVTIKATEAVTTGMVRLFILSADGSVAPLYKEIPIPDTPQLASTPTPEPMLLTYEALLEGGLTLAPGCRLIASTQNSESFNIIADSQDITYPGTLPPSCCNFNQEMELTGMGTVSVGNPFLNGGGAIVDIFTPGSGVVDCKITAITIKALQSTNEGIVRLFINNGTSYFLYKEIYIPQTTQSGFEPSYKVVLKENFHLASSYTISASTQLAQSFAITIEGIGWY